MQQNKACISSILPKDILKIICYNVHMHKLDMPIWLQFGKNYEWGIFHGKVYYGIGCRDNK